ncbi:MAG: carbohydrate porin [Enhydrobacter sp.]|nr:carbohydrate porin [Enhydrobacter sp.]
MTMGSDGVPTKSSGCLARWTAVLCWMSLAFTGGAVAQSASDRHVSAVSGNPGATESSTGTGQLGRLLGLRDEWGVRLGGLWLADTNVVAAGGAQPGAWSNNSALFLSLRVDAEKLVNWRGATFGVEFLQFNGTATNAQAGVVAGYNGIVGAPPFNRSELFQAWYLQEIVKDVLKVRIGRSVPTYDFGNVLRPVKLADEAQNIAAVSGLLFTPVFVNPSLLGAMPGYYNPGDGVTVNFAPTRSFYVNFGAYDGSNARGTQSGINPPMFNGYWFTIGEIGTSWTIGDSNAPGRFGIGLWRQTGQITVAGITDDGFGGFYLFGSQRVARGVNARQPNSSVSMFVQAGANSSETLPIRQYYGGGITGYGLIGDRALDSIGVGVGISRLNPALFDRPSEVMLQAYYQAHLFDAVFLQPTVSYIPTPGVSSATPGALALTMRLTVLF